MWGCHNPTFHSLIANQSTGTLWQPVGGTSAVTARSPQPTCRCFQICGNADLWFSREAGGGDSVTAWGANLVDSTCPRWSENWHVSSLVGREFVRSQDKQTSFLDSIRSCCKVLKDTRLAADELLSVWWRAGYASSWRLNSNPVWQSISYFLFRIRVHRMSRRGPDSMASSLIEEH